MTLDHAQLFPQPVESISNGGSPFTDERKEGIQDLTMHGTFNIVNKSCMDKDVRVFGSVFVGQLNFTISGYRYKSWLVAQIYDDNQASSIATRTKTNQRLTQRVIHLLAAFIYNIRSHPRDITQPYMQEYTPLERKAYIGPPE